MENSERLELETTKRTTQKERFAGFTLAHVFISLGGLAIAVPIAMGLASLSDFNPFAITAIAGEVFLLIMYVAAGAWMARNKQWSFPQRVWEGLWAFLAPALIAWAWGALVVGSLYLDAWPLLMVEFWGSLVFAFPSFLMVYLSLAFGMFDYSLFSGLGLVAFLAGGIPPLLFTLGSLWGSRKQVHGPTNVKEYDIDV